MGSLAGTTVCRLLRSSIFYSGIAALILAGCKGQKVAPAVLPSTQEPLPFYNTAEFDAEWIEESNPRYTSIHTIDTFSLLNQQGNIINHDSLDGHIYVANFFFTTCPGICPKMVSNLMLLQDSFAANPAIKLVSFSVMPWVDSVKVLRQYADAHNINASKWYLLTGNKDKIYTLGRQSYFAEKGLGLKKDSTEFLHTESMLLIDKNGRIRGIYNATQRVDIERVCDDIRVLLAEG